MWGQLSTLGPVSTSSAWPVSCTHLPTTHPASQPASHEYHALSAWPGPRISRVVCAAGPVRFSEYFHSSCCFSSCPRFRSRIVLVSPRLQISSRAAAHCPQSAYEAESVMPRYRPSDTVGRRVLRGLRSALIRPISSHAGCYEPRFLFSVEKARKYIWFPRRQILTKKLIKSRNFDLNYLPRFGRATVVGFSANFGRVIFFRGRSKNAGLFFDLSEQPAVNSALLAERTREAGLLKLQSRPHLWTIAYLCYDSKKKRGTS